MARCLILNNINACDTTLRDGELLHISFHKVDSMLLRLLLIPSRYFHCIRRPIFLKEDRLPFTILIDQFWGKLMRLLNAQHPSLKPKLLRILTPRLQSLNTLTLKRNLQTANSVKTTRNFDIFRDSVDCKFGEDFRFVELADEAGCNP